MKQLIATCVLLICTSLAIADPLVVYSGRGESLVGPLYAQFEKETGIKLDVRYNSTSAAATQLLHEAKDSPADVAFFQESGYLSALAEAGLLAKMDSEAIDNVDQRYRDKDNHWVGVSARLRVLAYNTDKLKPEQLPQDLSELADKKWHSRVGWAPTNASAQAHINVLRKLWGDEKTKQWLKALDNNGSVRYSRNSQIVRAIANGEIDLGWVNHYYLYQLKQQNPKLPVANFHFPEQGKAGNLLIVSGIGITHHSTKKQQAEKLVEFLLSERAQNYFHERNFEYPTRPELLKINPAESLAQIPLAPVDTIDDSTLTSTVKFLRDLNLL